MSKSSHHKKILVYADWIQLAGPQLLGTLQAEQVGGKETFSFSYDKRWLAERPALILDPYLQLYSGPQYNRDEQANFGLFTDSSPDRWGRVLMERREAMNARKESRRARQLMESDYLLGVYDLYRMGALRFRLTEDGPFIDDDARMAAPPMTSLRTLEEASYHLERDAVSSASFSKWLSILYQPGSSLGGARPKASVIDEKGDLWIAKFPSVGDNRDVGGWETVANELGIRSVIHVAQGRGRRLTGNHHTFLTKRFDRIKSDRIHFMSAMTMLGHVDGAGAANQVSYLHLAEFIMRHGAEPEKDLEELWKRIVFNICISNSDDHLRNHGFLLTEKGWTLSPAFDINPIPLSTGLSLNISEFSNEMHLDLARHKAEKFRVSKSKCEAIIEHITRVVTQWHSLAKRISIPKNELELMASAFEVKR